jgi:hypothetical protein
VCFTPPVAGCDNGGNKFYEQKLYQPIAVRDPEADRIAVRKVPSEQADVENADAYWLRSWFSLLLRNGYQAGRFLAGFLNLDQSLPRPVKLPADSFFVAKDLVHVVRRWKGVVGHMIFFPLPQPVGGAAVKPLDEVHSTLNASQELFPVNLRVSTLFGLDALELPFLYKRLSSNRVG